MSTTPLFDAIARRSTSPAARVAELRTPSAIVPTSPMAAPVSPSRSTFVPAALVAAIDDIPSSALRAAQRDHRVDADQLALVEAVADAITRAVVDAVVAELDRIAADGVVRG